jgi:glycosyltransferase involved in cell wall biosynthesis
LKVLFVTPHIFAGGAEKAVLNLVYQLNSMGCDAAIATLSLEASKFPSHLAQISFILPEKPLDQPTMKDVSTVLASTLREVFSFVALLRKFSKHFDIVCPCNFPAYWATYLARTKKPLVWLSSEVLAPYNQTKDVYDRSPLFRIFFNAAKFFDKQIVNSSLDPIITCSELNSFLIKKRYGRDSIVLHTGVDYDFFNTEAYRGSSAVSSIDGTDGPILLHVGALMQRKNQILSIRALKTLKPRLSSAKLVLVGEGPWEPILQAEARKLGLEEDVIFLGSISEEKLRSLYYACDVNLFPVKDQTWGLVPFEALAAGKPSIVAKGCGAAEFIEKEKIGIIIEPTVQSLTDAVLFALEHPDLTEDMVKRGQRFVQDNLTWQKYAADMFQVLGKVLKLNSLKGALEP